MSTRYTCMVLDNLYVGGHYNQGTVSHNTPVALITYLYVGGHYNQGTVSPSTPVA